MAVSRTLDKRGLPTSMTDGPVVAIWDERDGWCVGLHHDMCGRNRPPEPSLEGQPGVTTTGRGDGPEKDERLRAV